MKLGHWAVAALVGISGTGALGWAATHPASRSCCATRQAHAETAKEPISAASGTTAAAATAIPGTKSLKLAIKGVTCASCALGLRKALAKLDGVRDVELAESTAVVQYDPANIAPAAIIEAIVQSGYEATAV
ncbi:MAG: heavy-metal-associated domain-containing protein [Myxococcales bacterium]|nr:heavy-metal-associated domain-containing protein [Myxococcales bacterium]